MQSKPLSLEGRAPPLGFTVFQRGSKVKPETAEVKAENACAENATCPDNHCGGDPSVWRWLPGLLFRQDVDYWHDGSFRRWNKAHRRLV